MSSSSLQSCCRFDSIPEVPSNGALIKVCYAGAYVASNAGMRSRAFSTGSSASDSSPCLPHQRFTRNLSDEDGDSSDEEKLVVLRNSSGRTKDGSNNGGWGQNLTPHYEICGRIEMIGEDVDEEAIDLDIGDRVLILPTGDQAHQFSEYLEFISVPNLSDLVSIPDTLPMAEAALIPTGAHSVLPVLKAVRDHCLQYSYKEPPQALLVGTDELLNWGIVLWPYIFGLIGDGCKLALALQEDSSLWFEKLDKRINLVQWDNDVYDAQLIERTEEVCGGKVDLILDLGSSPKFFKRSINCLVKNGHAFLAKSSLNSSMKNFITKTFKKDVHVSYVDNGKKEDFEELIQISAHAQIQKLPSRVFSTNQVGEVRRILQCNCVKSFRPIFNIAAEVS